MSVQPISPDDIPDAKLESFPDFVFVAINRLIAGNYTNGRAYFTQDEAIKAIADLMMGDDFDMKRNEIFRRKWLNFEEVYRKAGWIVEYDRPAYCENYSASFTFRKPS